MKNFVVFLFCLVSFSSFSQFSDDFSDGDFTNNPTWSGNAACFLINSAQELQLNASKDASIAYLSLPSTRSTNTCWEFRVKINQNPSSSNYARVYLCSDNPDLTGELSGLYIRVGYSTDNISLHSQTNKRSKSLIAGAEKRLDHSPVDVKIKAVLEKNGTFHLYSQLEGEPDYVLEGECVIESIPQSQYFGVACYYSVTRLAHQSFCCFNTQVWNEADEKNSSDEEPNIDGDGVKIVYDYPTGLYHIIYQLDGEGYRCRLLIFDSVGRIVRHLCNDEELSTEGTIEWNGRGDGGVSLPRGVYIAYMELFNDKGKVKKYKLPVVVR